MHQLRFAYVSLVHYTFADEKSQEVHATMSDGPNGNPSYSVPALDKGLDILECLSRSRVPLTQARIARELGRRPSELFRMLTTLERRGYIQRDQISGAYDLTLRLYELGRAHSPYQNLLHAARWPMQNLAIELRESCHLGVIRYGQLVVLHQEEGPTRMRLSIEVGSAIPVLESASGRLLLAHLDDDERMDVLRRETDFSERSAADQEALLDRLAQIRARGYEAARGEQTAGVSDAAALVGSRTSQTKAALTVAALTRDHEMFLTSGLPMIQRCAQHIGRAAGIVTEP